MTPYFIIYLLLGVFFLQQPLVWLWDQGLCEDSFQKSMIKDTLIHINLVIWVTALLLLFWPLVLLSMYLNTR